MQKPILMKEYRKKVGIWLVSFHVFATEEKITLADIMIQRLTLKSFFRKYKHVYSFSATAGDNPGVQVYDTDNYPIYWVKKPS